MVHKSCYESSNDGESLPETTTTVVPLILAKAHVVAAIVTPPPQTTTPTPSALSTLEECLTCLEDDQVRIEDLL